VASEIVASTHKTERNNAIILDTKDFGNWKSALQDYFKPLKGISTFSEIIIDKKNPLGVIHARGYEEKELKMYKLLKSNLHPSSVLKSQSFLKLPERLKPLEQPQMQAKKQWDLYEKVRPFVPAEYQDIVCPKPNIEKDS